MKSLTLINKLFTAMIIFTMINLNIAINIEQAKVNFSTAKVYADDSSTSSGNDDVRSDDGTVVLENTQDNDSEAMTQKRQALSGTYNKEEESGFFSSGGMRAINIILLLCASFITAKLFMTFQPSRPWDLTFATLAGGIYIAGEAMSAFKGNSTLKDAKDSIKYEGLGEDGQVDISQKAILEKEREALNTAKEAAESKLKYQRVAGGAYAIAAATAGVSAYMLSGYATACGVTCTVAAPTVTVQETSSKIPNNSKLKLSESEILMAEITAAGITCDAGAITGQNGAACKQYVGSLIYNNGAKMPTGLADANEGLFKKSFYFALLSKFISSAYASAAGGIAIIIGLIATYVPWFDTLIDTWIFSPSLRAYLWLGISALALATAEDTDEQIEALDKNIKQIDDILKKFRSAQSVTKSAAAVQQKQSLQFGNYEPLSIGEETPCIGGLPKIATNNGSKGCPNAKNYIVKASEHLKTGGFKLSDGFVGSLVDATNGTHGVSSISPGTQRAFDNVGSQANAIHAKASKLLKKVFTNPKDKKSSGFNKKLATFNNAMRKTAAKMGGKRGGLMAALPYLDKQKDKAGKENSEEAKGLTVSTKGGNSLGKTNAPKADAFKFDFGDDEAEAYVADKNSEFDANAQALAKMDEDTEGQIIEDQSVDIWKAISVRYKKTAYDRLLKRIE